MTNQHPITPPPELVTHWLELWNNMPVPRPVAFEWMATCAARWGAEQELAACCVLMDDWGLDGKDLIECRRPKPLMLNSIALQMLGTIERDAHYLPEITDTIRRALEELP
jgi:hypothetical protein